MLFLDSGAADGRGPGSVPVGSQVAVGDGPRVFFLCSDVFLLLMTLLFTVMRCF